MDVNLLKRTVGLVLVLVVLAFAVWLWIGPDLPLQMDGMQELPQLLWNRLERTVDMQALRDQARTLYGYTVRYRYLFLFAFLLLEGTGLPLPFQALFFVIGYMFIEGEIQILIAFPVALVGQIIGYSLGYLFGLRGARSFLAAYGSYVGFTEDRRDTMQDWLERFGGLALCFTRVFGLLRSVAIWMAGVAKISFSRFLAYATLGIVVWLSFWFWFSTEMAGLGAELF